MTRFTRSLLALVALAPFMAGCATFSNKEKGAVIGAGAGAAGGAVIGHATGSTTRGAIIGAVVGGAAGAIIGHQMDQQAKELAYEIPGATVQRVGEGIAVTFPDGMLFAFDSEEILSGARTNLDRFAASMVKYPGTRAMVVGYTDAQGTAEYNQALSERRAQAAAGVLVGQGVASSRLGTVGRGETEPISDNSTDAGRQLNRRVEVAIYADAAFQRQAKTAGSE